MGIGTGWRIFHRELPLVMPTSLRRQNRPTTTCVVASPGQRKVDTMLGPAVDDEFWRPLTKLINRVSAK